MGKILFDTSCLIEYLRAKKKENTAFGQKYEESESYISIISLYELLAGATDPTKLQDVATLKEALNLLDFSEEVAETAAHIFQDLRKRNQLIGNNDIYIAATALVHELDLLTLNRKDFERIENLKLL